MLPIKRLDKQERILNYLFKHPIVDVREVQKITKLSYKVANNLVVEFIASQILKETTGQGRNRLFSFDGYLNLFTKSYRRCHLPVNTNSWLAIYNDKILI